MENIENEKIQLRKLQSTEFFKVSKLASKLDLDIKQLFKTINKLKKGIPTLSDAPTKEEVEAHAIATEENTIEIIDLIITQVFYKIHLVEKEMFELIALLAGKEEKEIRSLDISVFFGLITKLLKDSGFINFFK